MTAWVCGYCRETAGTPNVFGMWKCLACGWATEPECADCGWIASDDLGHVDAHALAIEWEGMNR